jgi:hypothetical protein
VVRIKAARRAGVPGRRPLRRRRVRRPPRDVRRLEPRAIGCSTYGIHLITQAGAASCTAASRTARFCPFAQRALLALNAKGADYRLHELSDADLYSKPAWFLGLNPAGLVPTLAWLAGDGRRRVLGESLVINE